METAQAPSMEMGPFWAAVRTLSEHGVQDPTPRLAKCYGRRLGSGQPVHEALRVAVDEVLRDARLTNA